MDTGLLNEAETVHSNGYSTMRRLPRLFTAGNRLEQQFLDVWSVIQGRPARWETFLRIRMFNLLTALIDTCRQNPFVPLTAEIMQALEFIETCIESGNKLRLEDVADQLHLSLSYFKMRFTREIGISPWKYICKRRVEIAQNLLCDGRSITDVSYELHYSSTQHFSTSFKAFTGLSPHEWLMNSQPNRT